MVFIEHNQSYIWQSISQQAALALDLRDFFLAENCYARAEVLGGLSSLPALQGADPLELEYEFNRLFIGPDMPLAPPYASVYLEKEPRLMGETTQIIARFYTALGLENSIAGLPPDFLALELEAWLVLEEMLAESYCADLIKARKFLVDHLKSWLPLFLGRLKNCQLSPAMAHIAGLLDEWLRFLERIYL